MMRIPFRLFSYAIVVGFDGDIETVLLFWGRGLVDIFWANYTGKSMAEVPERFRQVSIDTYP